METDSRMQELRGFQYSLSFIDKETGNWEHSSWLRTKKTGSSEVRQERVNDSSVAGVMEIKGLGRLWAGTK